MFPFLFGKTVIQRNRLTLTDEDALEYKTSETMTVKEIDYKNSRVLWAQESLFEFACTQDDSYMSYQPREKNCLDY